MIRRNIKKTGNVRYERSKQTNEERTMNERERKKAYWNVHKKKLYETINKEEEKKKKRKKNETKKRKTKK